MNDAIQNLKRELHKVQIELDACECKGERLIIEWKETCLLREIERETKLENERMEERYEEELWEAMKTGYLGLN